MSIATKRWLQCAAALLLTLLFVAVVPWTPDSVKKDVGFRGMTPLEHTNAGGAQDGLAAQLTHSEPGQIADAPNRVPRVLEKSVSAVRLLGRDLSGTAGIGGRYPAADASVQLQQPSDAGLVNDPELEAYMAEELAASIRDEEELPPMVTRYKPQL